MDVTAGLPFEAVFESGLPGLVPGIEVAVIDNVGNVVIPASGVGIAEQVVDGNPDTGIYAVTLTAPVDEGQYTIVWSTDGSFDTSSVSVEDLVVYTAGVSLPPIGVPPQGVSSGPCSLWTNIDDIADCCTMPEGVDQFVLIAMLTNAATSASELLYFASGKQYVGACERTVYPEADDCACGFQILSRGYVVGAHWGDVRNCCGVKLAGTVRAVTEVVINGVVVDPSVYEVRDNRWLVRIDGTHWPQCRGECGPRTFSVTYIYGKTPPVSGQRAARQLGCEIFKSCTNQECALPTGITRVTRQGVTWERSFLSRDDKGIWRSGLAEVDLFLNTVNPNGIPRKATFWSPSRRARYARG